MPKFPSSQTKAAPLSPAKLQATLQAAIARAPKRNPSLQSKVLKLRQRQSKDPIQQLQSDIISDLYDAVRELQVMMDPLLLQLPDVQDVRDSFGNP
jgi:hypothetical protein